MKKIMYKKISFLVGEIVCYFILSSSVFAENYSVIYLNGIMTNKVNELVTNTLKRVIHEQGKVPHIHVAHTLGELNAHLEHTIPNLVVLSLSDNDNGTLDQMINTLKSKNIRIITLKRSSSIPENGHSTPDLYFIDADFREDELLYEVQLEELIKNAILNREASESMGLPIVERIRIGKEEELPELRVLVYNSSYKALMNTMNAVARTLAGNNVYVFGTCNFKVAAQALDESVYEMLILGLAPYPSHDGFWVMPMSVKEEEEENIITVERYQDAKQYFDEAVIQDMTKYGNHHAVNALISKASYQGIKQIIETINIIAGSRAIEMQAKLGVHIKGKYDHLKARAGYAQEGPSISAGIKILVVSAHGEFIKMISSILSEHLSAHDRSIARRRARNKGLWSFTKEVASQGYEHIRDQHTSRFSEIIVVQRGKDALTKIQELHPEVVLIDFFNQDTIHSFGNLEALIEEAERLNREARVIGVADERDIDLFTIYPHSHFDWLKKNIPTKGVLFIPVGFYYTYDSKIGMNLTPQGSDQLKSALHAAYATNNPPLPSKLGAICNNLFNFFRGKK